MNASSDRREWLYCGRASLYVCVLKAASVCSERLLGRICAVGTGGDGLMVPPFVPLYDAVNAFSINTLFIAVKGVYGTLYSFSN